MLTIWGRRNSFNVQKVLWLADELALEYAHAPAGGGLGGLDEPAFRARNPHGRVPVIDDDGVVVWESHAILRYLAGRHGGARWWAEDPAARSLQDRWMDWSQASLQPDFLNGVFWGFYRTPPEQRDMARVEAAIARCSEHFKMLDAVLASQPWLGGDEIGLADIPAGTALYRYFELEIGRPSVPNVVAWYERLQVRPAYRAHVMTAFDDLEGRLAY